MRPDRGDQRGLRVLGLPEGVPEKTVVYYRSKLMAMAKEFMEEAGLSEVSLQITTEPAVSPARGEPAGSNGRKAADHDDLPVEKRAERYRSVQPYYDFDQLIVPEKVKEDLISALGVIRVQPLVFDHWGLRKIEPFPRTALSFQGLPGTGKTLAAHALAKYLGRPILIASYADIESKFHGDGPKNVEAVFHAATRDEAVLFIDEAESLLSKRLAEANTGSESAINSMRSQLLICLEKFKGVAIFATNLVQSYDEAFDTRVRHIEFPMPDEACRRKIWEAHLPETLPRAPGFSVESLAAGCDDLCGRDIKNAVIDAAVRAALAEKPHVDEADLHGAIGRIRESRIKRNKPGVGHGRPLNDQEKAEAEAKIREALKKAKESGQA